MISIIDVEEEKKINEENNNKKEWMIKNNKEKIRKLFLKIIIIRYKQNILIKSKPKKGQ